MNTKQFASDGHGPSPGPRVAALVDTASTWGRGIITGIRNYSRTQRDWSLFVEVRDMNSPVVVPQGWHGEGIIARVSTPELALYLRSLQIPIVNVSGIQMEGLDIPRVSNDVEEAARMGVDYFLSRGYKNFAYLSLSGLSYIANQRQAFVEATTAAGLNCAFHSVEVNEGFQSADWNLKLDQLGIWLQSLPKPVCIFSWSGGREVIHACRQIGLRVPEEVAFLSGTEDELLCECSPIPISSVQAACQQIGYESAALLDKLMHGAVAPTETRFIPPLRVITRQSTDTTAISDPALISAIEFIRKNATQPIQVNEVATHVGLSRRVLERRFKNTLECTPAYYIAAARIALIKEILVETDLSIGEVAEKCGFATTEYMCYVFRTEVGTTPLRYRRESRGRHLPMNPADRSF